MNWFKVLSGDTVVIRGKPVGGPPPEKVLSLAGISAPRLARRPTAGQEAEADEPFAWEAREFLRSKLVGKEVSFVIEYSVPVRSKCRVALHIGIELDVSFVSARLGGTMDTSTSGAVRRGRT